MNHLGGQKELALLKVEESAVLRVSVLLLLTVFVQQEQCLQNEPKGVPVSGKREAEGNVKHFVE
jgi:hypothetical protein